MSLITISIVSHCHGPMVESLVKVLIEFSEVTKIIITKNIPEIFNCPDSSKIAIIENKLPKGFGANHNFAFMDNTTDFFCPMNPDIHLLENPFPRLIETQKWYEADLIAPLVLNKDGDIEDSIRYFPTIFSLIKKMVFNNEGTYDLVKNGEPFSPEWVAGMFMFFKSDSFKVLGGFDEKYFLYYEDVDICVRLWQHGMRLLVNPDVSVVHDARRASRKNLAHMKLHLISMAFYLVRYFGKLPSVPPLKKNA